jgi:hypothetical protein
MLQILLFCVMAWCIGCLNDIPRIIPSDQISKYLILDEIQALQVCNKNMLQTFHTPFPDSLIEECARIITIAQADVGQEFAFSIWMTHHGMTHHEHEEYLYYTQSYTTLYQEFIYSYEVQTCMQGDLKTYDCDTLIQFLKRYCQKPNEFKCYKIFMPMFDDIRPLIKQMPSIIPTGFVIQKNSIDRLDKIIQCEDEASKNIGRFDKLVRYILHKLQKPQQNLYVRMKNNLWCFIKDLYWFRI